jgi:hypothetical protein
VSSARRYVPDLPPVFLGRQAVQDRLLTPGQLRGPAVRRVLHGVYRLASTPESHEVRCLAACLLLPTSAAVTGPSAATVLGVPLASPTDDVRMVTPEGLSVPRRRGVHVSEASEPFAATTRPDGLRLADRERVAFDAAFGQRLPQAVAALDAMARAGVMDPDALTRWLDHHHGNGVRAVREAVRLVDPRAQSRPESVMRVALVTAGLPVVPQYVVLHCGRFVARLDLGLPEWQLGIEYDGAWHALREQLERDRARLNRLHEAGWNVVHVTADMLHRPDELVTVVRAAMQRAQRAS